MDNSPRWVRIACFKNCCCTLSDAFTSHSLLGLPSSEGMSQEPGFTPPPPPPPPSHPSPGCAATSSLQQDFLCAMKMLRRCVWIWSNLGSAKCRNQPEEIRTHTGHPCLFLLPWFHSGLSAGQPQALPPHSRPSDKNRRSSSFSTYTPPPSPLLLSFKVSALT